MTAVNQIQKEINKLKAFTYSQSNDSGDKDNLSQ
jgi:hypothetical protein